MADSRIPADINDAVYRVVRDFGVERLASITGQSPGVLYNKTSLSLEEHNKPTLADALIWTLGTRDLRIVQALSRCVGGVHVSLAGLAQQSDAALLDLVLRRSKEDGEFASQLMSVLDRGAVSPADYDRLHKEGYEAIAAFIELLLRLEDMSRG